MLPRHLIPNEALYKNWIGPTYFQIIRIQQYLFGICQALASMQIVHTNGHPEISTPP